MNGLHGTAAISLALVLGGCADSPDTAKSSQGNTVTASNDAPKKICHHEYPTGSNIPMTVCKSAEEIADDARNTEAAQRQITQDSAISAAQHAGTSSH